MSRTLIPHSLSLIHISDIVIRTEMRKLFSGNNFFGNNCSLISHIDISEISSLKSASREIIKYSQNELIRWRGAVRVLLLSVKLSSGANQKKKKKIAIIYCRKCVSMIENRVSGYLYNELFSESNGEKCTVFQSMACFFIVHENTIKNCSTAFQAFSVWSLSFCILYFLFHKGNDTSAILNQAFSILYMFLLFS